MPQVRMRDAGGVLRTITRIRMRDASNVLRTIQQVRMRDAGGTLRTVFLYFTVALDIYNEFESNSGAASSGTVTSDLITGTVTGGAAPFTYLWEFVSGSPAIAPDTPTTNTTTFSATISDGPPYVATWRLKATDNNGAIVYSDNVEISLLWIDTR